MKVTEKPENIELISLNDYLKNIKTMLFFSFCNFCKNVKCSLDNPDYFDELKSKKVFGEFQTKYKILTCIHSKQWFEKKISVLPKVLVLMIALVVLLIVKFF